MTSRAPRTNPEGPNGPAPASARRTTSGSRMASSPSKSPSRDAARKASTTVHCLARSALPAGEAAAGPAVGRGRDGVRRRGAQAVPGPAGQLLGRGRRTVKYRADLLEGHGEDVVQDEREPLGRRQRVQDDQQGDADGIGQDRVLGGIIVDPRDDRVGHVRVQRVLAASRPGAQHVQAHAGHDGGEPRAQVPDVAGVRSGQTQPGLLHRVVGLVQRAEHAVGHRAQVRPVLLKTVCLEVRPPASP